MRVRAGTILLVAFLLPGCLSRDRLNPRCEWTEQSAGPLNLADRADQRHLEADVDLAEELGVRYGDAFRRTAGVVVDGQRRVQCTEALLQTISQAHGVSSEAVRAARGRRSLSYELVVEVIPPAALLLIVAWPIAGALSQRVERPIPRLVATAGMSVLASIFAYQIANMWAGIAESYRVRDGHLSYRASYLLPSRHPVVLLAGAALLFAGVAVVRYRTTSPDRVDADDRAGRNPGSRIL